MNTDWNWLEVLKYDVADADGDIFKKGCLGDIDGVSISLRWGFDIREPLGIGTLHDGPDALWVQVPIGTAKYLIERHPGPIEACFGGSCQERLMDGSITKATICEIGLVAKGNKTSQNLVR